MSLLLLLLLLLVLLFVDEFGFAGVGLRVVPLLPAAKPTGLRV
jgi:hypothetical protein